MKLKVVKGHPWGVDAVTQTFGVIGAKGSGKTYTTGVMAEAMVGANAQVIALDPVGTQYGLRIAADGKGPGLDIPVFGGLHGDIPITPTSGGVVAEFAVKHRRSLVLDVSQFRKAERVRFVTAFAEEIFHRKKSDRTPLHIILDEAHLFVPERGNEHTMVGAWEDIVRLGRNFGIGVTMVTQRPQSVNKQVLNMVECLIVHRVLGYHERDAIQKWVDAKGVTKSLIDELSKLRAGQAVLWSPEWLEFFGRVEIETKRTLDSSATPKVGTRKMEAKCKPLDAGDIEALRSAMSQVVEEAKANDPKVMRDEIARLRRALAQAESKPGKPTERTDAAIKTLVASMQMDHNRRAQAASKLIREAAADLFNTMRKEFDSRLDAMVAGMKVVGDAAGQALAAMKTERSPSRSNPRPSREPANPAPPGSGLSTPHRKVLGALAWWKSHGVERPTTLQVAVIAGYSDSGTFQTYLSSCASSGLIERGDGSLSMTEAGRAHGVEKPDVTLENAACDLLQKLKGTGQSHIRILGAVLAHDGDEMPVEDLADKTGFTNSGTFQTYLSKLSGLGFIVRSRGMVMPNSAFWFPGA